MAVCYRHPDRETGVSCSNCGNPICPDCMTPTPVGMRCPDCAKQKTKVRNVAAQYNATPYVTYGLIGICLLLYIGTVSSNYTEWLQDFALVGPLVPDEPYRLITSGFMHAENPLHVGFNMYILYFLGNMLEPSLGPYRFGLLYLASLLSGSLAVVIADSNAFTVGASGAVYGLMGAAFAMQYARGIDPMQSGIGPLILFNLVLSFVIPNVSIAGHIGGLIGGGLAGYLMDQAQSRRLPLAAQLAVPAVIAVAAAGAAIALAPSLTFG